MSEPARTLQNRSTSEYVRLAPPIKRSTIIKYHLERSCNEVNELQIIRLENTDISGWDFSSLRAELQSRLDFYAGLVYTDETIKNAKEARTTLNKVKKVIEDARKAYKARCLAPYDALEPEMKSLVDMVEKQRALIDDTIKEYEARQKQAKEQEIKRFYNRKAIALGDLAERLYPAILDSKWLNASFQKSKYEEEIVAAIASAAADIEAIRAWRSPFIDTLTEFYCHTLSMDRVKEKQLELEDAAKKASLTAEKETHAANYRALLLDESDKTSSQFDGGIVLRIVATQKQLDQITDFMKAIGVQYELV